MFGFRSRKGEGGAPSNGTPVVGVRIGARKEAAIGAPEAGLTLIEVIVALALSALVVAFLAQGTGMIRHMADLGRRVSAQDETLAVRDHLRRTVESARRGGGPAQRDGFAGVGGTAVFTVPGDPLLESGGLVRITLAAVAEGGRMSLVETRLPLAGPPGSARTRRLLTGASRVVFAYSGAAAGSTQWFSEWTDPSSGPSLMRIDVGLPPGDTRLWPPFLILMPTGIQAGPAAAPAKPG